MTTEIIFSDGRQSQVTDRDIWNDPNDPVSCWVQDEGDQAFVSGGNPIRTECYANGKPRKVYVLPIRNEVLTENLPPGWLSVTHTSPQQTDKNLNYIRRLIKRFQTP
jgi:hypothetical protein